MFFGNVRTPFAVLSGKLHFSGGNLKGHWMFEFSVTVLCGNVAYSRAELAAS